MCENSVLLREVAYELWYRIALQYDKRFKKDPQKRPICVKMTFILPFMATCCP